jgi:chromosome segregation ATPase
VVEGLARAEAAEKELKSEISALYARLERSSKAGEEAKKTARDLEGRFKADLERLRDDLAGSLCAGFTRLEERLAVAEASLNSLGAGGGPFAVKGDLEPISRELGALRFELSSIAGRADSLARALPELSRIAPKVDLLEGGYSEFLQSLRKVYEIDSRYSYLSGKLDEMSASVESIASGRTKDRDRFSRLEVKTVELEGRADHLSSLFNYFRDILEKYLRPA